MLAAGSVYMVLELQAQRDGALRVVDPNWSLIRTSGIIIELGFFGLAVGLHGGVLLLMPCTAFILTALLGNLGMIAAGWVVLVATLGMETGLQVPATDAFWLTVLFAGTALITAMMLHVAMEGTLYGFGRNQSLAVLASYAGTLRHWPGDLEPIAGRLAETLDIDRYVIYDGVGRVQSTPSCRGRRPAGRTATSSATFRRVPPRPVARSPVVTWWRRPHRRPASTSCWWHRRSRYSTCPWTSACSTPEPPFGRHVRPGPPGDRAGRSGQHRRADRHRQPPPAVPGARGGDGPSRRGARTFAVAILDLDHFKEYNDRGGHVAGDRMLQRFCALVGQRIRAQDLLARYGGEEFCVVLPETEAEGAVVLVDDIRQWILSDGGVDGITFSAGVAGWDGSSRSTRWCSGPTVTCIWPVHRP